MKSAPTGTFLQEESRFDGSYSRSVFKTIFQTYQPWMARAIMALVLAFLARLFLLFNTNVLGFWADSFCREGPNCKPLPHLLIGFGSREYAELLLALAAIGLALNTTFRIMISRVGTHAVSLFYDEVTYRASRFPMSFFDTTPVGRMLTRFSSDYGAIFRMLGGPMGEFLSLVFDLFLMIVLTGVASPWFVPVVLIAFIINFFVYRMNLDKVRKERRAMSRVRGPAIAHFSETVQGAQVVKVFGRETVFARRFVELVDELVTQRIRTVLTISWFGLQMTVATSSLILFTGFVGFFLVHRQLVTVGALAVVFTFVMMSSVTVQNFFEWLANLEEALTGFERLDEYLRHSLEPAALLPAATRLDTGHAKENAGKPQAVTPFVAKVLQAECASVEIQDLTLRYRANFPLVLDAVTISVRAGEHLGIIGRTGSGKSTLIQALFHLYPFERGRIAVEDFDVFAPPDSHRAVALNDFRRAIALIPQEPILFRGPLRDNLRPATSSQNDHQLLDALKTVGLEEFVDSLPEPALDYHILERGTNLSMGQRQLICLARCLLQQTPILVMDEATSAVDPVSEGLLMRALQSVLAKKTRIVVAHRLSTIENCDRVLWLESGRIRAVGTPSEVLPQFGRI